MLRTFKLFFFASLISLIPQLNGEIIRRAVFDFGSGGIRLHVADVDTENHLVINTLYAGSTRVFLSEDLAKQSIKRFSDEIQQIALQEAVKLKLKANELGTKEFYGIATEAYRLAANGEALIKKYCEVLEMPVVVISKETEGKLSFLSLSIETKSEPRDLICCDIGGGSFQMTFMDTEGNIHSYHAPYGRLTAKIAILAQMKFKNGTPSSNPWTLMEWEEGFPIMSSLLPKVPPKLIEKIKDPNVKIIGVAGHPPELAAKGIYRFEDLLSIRDHYLNKFDYELICSQPFFHPAYAVTDLILVGALMNKLGINEFTYFESRGTSNSTSLLVTEEIWRGEPKDNEEEQILCKRS